MTELNRKGLNNGYPCGSYCRELSLILKGKIYDEIYYYYQQADERSFRVLHEAGRVQI